jgi:two-component system chemotaxis response regulator CheB
MSPPRVRVMIADPSPAVELALRLALVGVADIEVVATHSESAKVLASLKRHTPDVLLLGAEAKRLGMAGHLLPQLMSEAPLPTIVVWPPDEAPSREDEARVNRLGAVAVFQRRRPEAEPEFAADIRARLVPLVRRVARVKVVRMIAPQAPAMQEPSSVSLRMATPTPVRDRVPPVPQSPLPANWPTQFLVVIGSSTGGPTALASVLRGLPAGLAVPIVIAQHIPEGFTGDLVRHLSAECAIEVRECADGERVRPGVAYVAPGTMHVRVRPGGVLSLFLPSGRNESCPSVDELFATAAASFGDRLLSVVLTGMGSDGAAGTRAVKAMGGRTIAQDEASSMIYGMPKEAAATGCVDIVAPPAEITRHIESFAMRARRGAAGGGTQ